MSFYIKYPPEGDTDIRPPRVVSCTLGDGHNEPAEWEPFARGMEAEFHSTVREIRICKASFDDTGNPLYALEAFRLATSVKLYPPLWVIEFIDQRFRHALTNELTLDRAFGFSTLGLGKGKSTDPKASDKLRVRSQNLCMAIFKLEGAGLSRPAACKALSSLLARLPDGTALAVGGDKRFAISRMDISGKGIEKAVTNSADSWPGEAEETANAAKSWTDSEKASLLSIFYPSELPTTIQN